MSRCFLSKLEIAGALQQCHVARNMDMGRKSRKPNAPPSTKRLSVLDVPALSCYEKNACGPDRKATHGFIGLGQVSEGIATRGKDATSGSWPYY